jgi:hypothetical protein
MTTYRREGGGKNRSRGRKKIHPAPVLSRLVLFYTRPVLGECSALGGGLAPPQPQYMPRRALASPRVGPTELNYPPPPLSSPPTTSHRKGGAYADITALPSLLPLLLQQARWDPYTTHLLLLAPHTHSRTPIHALAHPPHTHVRTLIHTLAHPPALCSLCSLASLTHSLTQTPTHTRRNILSAPPPPPPHTPTRPTHWGGGKGNTKCLQDLRGK